MALSPRRASNRALRIFIAWLYHNGYQITESLPHDSVARVHARGSWHYDTYIFQGRRYSMAVDINWPGGGAAEKQALKRASVVASGLGLAFISDLTGQGIGSASTHKTHGHSDPGSWSNYGSGPFIPPRGTEKVYDAQVLLGTPLKKRDNLHGWDTHKRWEAVRQASRAFRTRFPWGVRYTQSILGVPQTGTWDSASRAGHDRMVAALQKVLGVPQTGTWDKTTDAAYVAFSRKYRRF